MQPGEFRGLRLAAGLSTARAAAEALESDVRTVQRWEAGHRAVPGPARVALRLLRERRDIGAGTAGKPANP